MLPRGSDVASIYLNPTKILKHEKTYMLLGFSVCKL